MWGYFLLNGCSSPSAPWARDISPEFLARGGRAGLVEPDRLARLGTAGSSASDNELAAEAPEAVQEPRMPGIRFGSARGGGPWRR
jgi:hypothetical protein